MKLKAFSFFDLDGVLVVSENLHWQAWEKVLEKLKINIEDFNSKQILGFSDSQIVEFLKQKYHLPKKLSLEDLIEQKRQFFNTYIEKGFASPVGRDNFLNFFKNSNRD